jgi:hypothetical protein
VDENPEKNNCKRDCSNAETPHNEGMAFTNADDRIEYGSDQQTHDKSTDMSWEEGNV